MYILKYGGFPKRSRYLQMGKFSWGVLIWLISDIRNTLGDFFILFSWTKVRLNDLLGWIVLQPRHTVLSPSHAACSHTWSCCCLASSICCLCFSICEAASFFCSSWAARSCSLRLLNWPIMPMSWRSFSARLSGVPIGQEEGGRGSKVRW